jgi:hypothetical protein
MKGFLNYEVEYSISRIFESELNLIRKIKQKVKALVKCKDFDMLDSFHEIDTFTSGTIDFENLKRFLTNNAGFAEENIIKGVLERIGNLQGEIDISRFYNIFDIYSSKRNINFCLPANVQKNENSKNNVYMNW